MAKYKKEVKFMWPERVKNYIITRYKGGSQPAEIAEAVREHFGDEIPQAARITNAVVSGMLFRYRRVQKKTTKTGSEKLTSTGNGNTNGNKALLKIHTPQGVIGIEVPAGGEANIYLPS